MQAGSVRVSEGDVVEQGDVIESFETTGELESTEVFDRIENTPRKVPVLPPPGETEHSSELPLDLTLLTFP